jgi:hypothetical protein
LVRRIFPCSRTIESFSRTAIQLEVGGAIALFLASDG